MRPSQNSKRMRGRSPRRKHGQHGQSGNRTVDSAGPNGRIRGNAAQVYEKYQSLARDALASGDRVAAENFFQHADHYFRVMAANGGAPGSQRRQTAGDQTTDDQSPREKPSGDVVQPDAAKNAVSTDTPALNPAEPEPVVEAPPAPPASQDAEAAEKPAPRRRTVRRKPAREKAAQPAAPDASDSAPVNEAPAPKKTVRRRRAKAETTKAETDAA